MFDHQFRVLNEEQSSKLFTWILAASQIFGVCMILSVVSWMGGYNEGGYSWSADPEKQVE
jgi:hypothetical protein